MSLGVLLLARADCKFASHSVCITSSQTSLWLASSIVENHRNHCNCLNNSRGCCNSFAKSSRRLLVILKLVDFCFQRLQYRGTHTFGVLPARCFLALHSPCKSDTFYKMCLLHKSMTAVLSPTAFFLLTVHESYSSTRVGR